MILKNLFHRISMAYHALSDHLSGNFIPEEKTLEQIVQPNATEVAAVVGCTLNNMVNKMAGSHYTVEERVTNGTYSFWLLNDGRNTGKKIAEVFKYDGGYEIRSTGYINSNMQNDGKAMVRNNSPAIIKRTEKGLQIIPLNVYQQTKMMSAQTRDEMMEFTNHTYLKCALEQGIMQALNMNRYHAPVFADRMALAY